MSLLTRDWVKEWKEPPERYSNRDRKIVASCRDNHIVKEKIQPHLLKIKKIVRPLEKHFKSNPCEKKKQEQRNKQRKKPQWGK